VENPSGDDVRLARADAISMVIWAFALSLKSTVRDGDAADARARAGLKVVDAFFTDRPPARPGRDSREVLASIDRLAARQLAEGERDPDPLPFTDELGEALSGAALAREALASVRPDKGPPGPDVRVGAGCATATGALVPEEATGENPRAEAGL